MTPDNKNGRAGIETEPLVAQLREHALGNIELGPAQVRSLEILLRKVLPDLAAVKAADVYDRENDPLKDFL
jgi:hypothetical protein